MSFLVRPVDGTLGSAIAISDSGGEEHKLAVFADAGIRDFALIGDKRCVLISRKRGIAIVDLHAREVFKRGILPRPFDRIAVAKNGARALAYHCNPGLLAFIDLASLASTAEFNLIQLRDDGAFDLLHRDHEAMREAKTPWDSIPFSDGPLRDEVRADELWLKYAPKEPTGLRRMRFTRSARAVFRMDGKVVLPFEFSVNGPDWVTDRRHARPITMSAHLISVGVATIDEDAARAEMRVLRQRAETSVYTKFPVRSISPDGTRAILQSGDLLSYNAEPDVPAGGGLLRKVFGRKGGGKPAFGLEQWNVAHEPRLEAAFPFRSLDAGSLLPIDTQRFYDAAIGEARREIGLIFPGVEAGFHDQQEQWLSSPAKRQADTYFDPFETRDYPAWNPPFNRVHYPPLFAEVAQRLAKLHPEPFSNLPWDRLGDREKRFVSGILHGWAEHFDRATDSIVWVGTDRFVVLSRDGTVREVSIIDGLGETYQLADPEKQAWPFSDRTVAPPQLQHVSDRAFAVDLFNFWLEFELPPFAKARSLASQTAKPLYYRTVIDQARHDGEVKQVDRLTEKIRRGYVKVGAKDAKAIIDGLHQMTREVRDYLNEIVVDHRWVPTLYHRGKPITEVEFCHILSGDGSEEAIRALDGLLSAFLDATTKDIQNVWHPDDLTPTMGPVSLALVRLSNSLPGSVMRFYARRDMDHDAWTCEAFERLDLPQQRLLGPCAL